MSATDPLAPLLDLPGVAEAVTEASEGLARLHRHRANLRGWTITGAEAVLRGARASAQLDGGSPRIPEDGTVDDPILAGSLRAADLLAPDGVSATVTDWMRAPLQVMARLNVLATPLADAAIVPGRPRPATTERLHLLAHWITTPKATTVGAVVVSGIIHGEILTLAPFAAANGVTARACSRLATIASGLDPRGLGVPEVWWNRHRSDYAERAAAFATGDPEAVAAWLRFHAQGLNEGALEGKSIADAR